MTDRDEVLKKCTPIKSEQFEGEFIDEESYNKEGRLVDLKNLEELVKKGVANYKKKCDEAIERAKKNNEGGNL